MVCVGGGCVSVPPEPTDGRGRAWGRGATCPHTAPRSATGSGTFSPAVSCNSLLSPLVAIPPTPVALSPPQ